MKSNIIIFKAMREQKNFKSTGYFLKNIAVMKNQ